jgi:hypothetical protein
MQRSIQFCVVLTLVSLAGLTNVGLAQQTGGTNNQTGGGTSQAASAADAAAQYRQTTGSERFLRENRDPTQMVGEPITGVGATRGSGATGQAGRTTGGQNRFNPFGGSNQFNQFNQLGNLYGAGLYNSLNNRRQQLRMPVQLGFQPANRPVTSVVTGRLQSRLQRIPRIRDMGSVSVELNGSTAVLRGEVATEADRQLVGRMLLLEPGVSEVRNELLVASASSDSP